MRAREVVVHRERFAIDGGGVAGRVRAAVQRDPTQRLAGRAVAVHVQRRVHRRSSSPPTSRRTGAATACRRRSGRHRARARPWRWSSAWVDSHTVRKHSTCRHRPDATASIAFDDRARLPGRLRSAADPRRAQAQGVLHRGDAALRVAAGTAAAARVGREPVDVVASEAGVVDGTQAGLDGERERVAHQPATELATSRSPRWPPCPRTCRATPSGARAAWSRLRPAADRARDRRWARTAGARRRRAARTPPPPACPDAPSPGAHPTTFVVRRTRSSSSSATIAMTYGGAIAGSHWCTFTVHPTTVPRPETSTTSISVEWQYGQTGVGGKSSAPHGMLRCTRSTPSRPAVQKNSFSGVSSGSGTRLAGAHRHSSSTHDTVMAMVQPPTGTVTFLFTDLEGSTRLWQEHPEAMQRASARHDELVRDAIEAHDGYVVKTTGDGFHAAFATRARSGRRCGRRPSSRCGAEPWEATGPLRVRMGIHSGPAEVRDGDYYGTRGEPGGAADVRRARRADRRVARDRGAGPRRRGRAGRPG